MTLLGYTLGSRDMTGKGLFDTLSSADFLLLGRVGARRGLGVLSFKARRDPEDGWVVAEVRH